MKLQFENIIYDVSDTVTIERLKADGFVEVGTEAPEVEVPPVEVDENTENTGNAIEKVEPEIEKHEEINLNNLVKAELMELLDSKGIKYSGSATKETLVKIALDNKLGEA